MAGLRPPGEDTPGPDSWTQERLWAPRIGPLRPDRRRWKLEEGGAVRTSIFARRSFCLAQRQASLFSRPQLRR